MITIANILLPVDFSERSAAAASYAKELACRFTSNIVMMHALPPLDAMYGMEMGYVGLGDFLEKRRADAHVSLDVFLEEELGSLVKRRVLAEGDPALEIIKLAHEESFDLIVMPTHGYGPFRRFVLGSVTAKVLHDADCAVLTGTHLAPEGAAEPVSFRNILCALDLGPQSGQALAWAAYLAGKYHSNLTLLHALPPVSAGVARYFETEFQVKVEEDARGRLEELARQANVPASILIEHGDVASVVKSVAGRMRADLTVIGRHQSSGVLGRLRAHAYAIVRESPCAVLSV
jgi:nucleotide-binding universal stress UspA family protein